MPNLIKKKYFYWFLGLKIIGFLFYYFNADLVNTTINNIWSSIYSTSPEIVVLEPETEIYKKKPDYPGGIEVPNSDSLVYEKLKESSEKVKANQITLLPDPEKPLKEEFQKYKSSENDESQEHRPKFIDSIDEILANIDYDDEFKYSEDSPETSLPSKELENVTSSNSKIIIANKDGIDNKNDLKDRLIDKIHVYRSYDTIHHSDLEYSSNISSGYFIQLAVAHNEQEADKIWQRIKSKNNKALSNNIPVVKKISNKENKIFFLVLTGPYSSYYNAKLVCISLKHNKQSCIVTK